jgi:DNA-directed RNA polymerase specialized sigma24 family protein
MAWRATQEYEQSISARQQYDELIVELWEELQSDCMAMISARQRNDTAHDTFTLAMNLFSMLVEELPSLSIDTDRPVRNLLKQILRRRNVDEWRREHPNARQRAKGSATNIEKPPAAGDAHMWPAHGMESSESYIPDPSDGMIDASTIDLDERIIRSIDNAQVISLIQAFWPKNLSKEDMAIMRLRYLEDPEKSFREIATRLGKGWTEETVRQRHYRAVQKTRQFLREQGFL